MIQIKIEDALRAAVEDDPEATLTLIRILEMESAGKKPWNWATLSCNPGLLNRLARRGILKIVNKQPNVTNYVLADPEATETWVKSNAPDESSSPDIFEEVVGYERVKQYLKRVLYAPRPVHCLLVGEPGSSKTVLLDAVARLPGSRVLHGPTIRKQGLARWLNDYGYDMKYLLIDEIHHMDQREFGVLLPLLGSGDVSEMKTNRTMLRRGLDIRCIAAGNSTAGLPEPLMDRFATFYFQPYEEVEFLEVARRCLMLRENVDPDLAFFIAQYAWANGVRSVRPVVRLARMGDSIEEVQWALATEREYGREQQAWVNPEDR